MVDARADLRGLDGETRFGHRRACDADTASTRMPSRSSPYGTRKRWATDWDTLRPPRWGCHLADLVRWCVAHGEVRGHPLTAAILSRFDAIRSVADIAALAGLSTRQLQRTLRQITGFAPQVLHRRVRLGRAVRRHRRKPLRAEFDALRPGGLRSAPCGDPLRLSGRHRVRPRGGSCETTGHVTHAPGQPTGGGFPGWRPPRKPTLF